MSTIQCPACKGPRLTEEFPYASYENHVRIPGAARGLLRSKKDLRVRPTLARLCYDCGYVLLFLSPEDVKRVFEGTQTDQKPLGF